MRLVLLSLFTLAACHDSPPAVDAAPPDAPHAVCTDPPPAGLGCEESHQDIADCPALEDVCNGVCGAAYECCYCNDQGEWAVEFTDCPVCDAGP